MQPADSRQRIKRILFVREMAGQFAVRLVAMDVIDFDALVG
jgi:hypothetical protein